MKTKKNIYSKVLAISHHENRFMEKLQQLGSEEGEFFNVEDN
jgi:hypothetical protein